MYTVANGIFIKVLFEMVYHGTSNRGSFNLSARNSSRERGLPPSPKPTPMVMLTKQCRLSHYILTCVIFWLQDCWSLFSSGGASKLAMEYDLPLLGTIPLDPVSVECSVGR